MLVLVMLKRYDEAISCYDRALEIDPKNSGVLNNKGNALIILGRHDEANKYLDRALDLDPRNVNAWYNKGSIFNQSKKYNEAISCYDRALEIDPKNSNALHMKEFSKKKTSNNNLGYNEPNDQDEKERTKNTEKGKIRRYNSEGKLVDA